VLSQSVTTLRSRSLPVRFLFSLLLSPPSLSILILWRSPCECAVNHTGGVKQAAHLLQYDSVLGTFDSNVEVADDETMVVDGQPVRVCASRDPAQLPWDQLGVDIVIEGTGVFVDSAGAGKHIQAGAKRVLITAPAKGDDIPTYVVGVNEENFDPNAEIVSNASCTTNCLAPYVKVLNDTFGIKEGQMTTTHSYTGDQRLLDASHRDLRRARAAALNVVPTSTGAAKAVSLALPEMKGKLDGFALRIPTPNVSLCDLTFTTEKPVTKRDINQSFQDARYNNPVISHVMDYTEKPLVSSDYIMTDVSTTIDGSLTQVAPSGHLAKVIAWYANHARFNAWETMRNTSLSFTLGNTCCLVVQV